MEEEGKGEVIENKTKSWLRKIPIIEGKWSFLPARPKKNHTMVHSPQDPIGGTC